MKRDKTYELGKRLLLMVLILAIYMAGRSLLLYDVDCAAYQLDESNSQNIILSMVSGDRHRYTVFALGIMPYIMSSLMMWIFVSIRGAEYKSRLSPQGMERRTLALALVIVAASAVSRAGDLVFKESRFDTPVLRAIAVIEMVAGACVIYKMAVLNKERGIGGQTPIILVNIVDNLISTIQRFTWEQLQRPVCLGLIMAGIILIMENVIVRIPVQRVSIHNMYADKSYIAMKLDPIGVMPVMFAASFFMIVQMIVRFCLLLRGDSAALQSISADLDLNSMTGAAVYLGIIFMLNVIFSFLMLSPGEMADDLQKAGDSIVNVYAGEKTKWYLRRKLLLLALLSGSLLCLMMGTSLGLALAGEISPELAMLPATGMILAGILYPLYREVKAYWKFDSYSFFI